MSKTVLAIIETERFPQEVANRAAWIAQHYGCDLELVLSDPTLGFLRDSFMISADSKQIAETIKQAQAEAKLSAPMVGVCQSVNKCIIQCAINPHPTYDECVAGCWDMALELPDVATLSALDGDLDPAQTDAEALGKAIVWINEIQQLQEDPARSADVLIALRDFFQADWEEPLPAWVGDLYFTSAVSDMFLSHNPASEHDGSLLEMLREIAVDGTP